MLTIEPVDHEGTAFESVTAMCRSWGVNETTFMKRMKRGWSLEKALATGPHIYKDHIGQTFHSREDLCQYWNLSMTTYLEQCSQGLRVQDITAQNAGQTAQVRDHKGVVYASPKDMCQQYGISVSSYINRINLHLSGKANSTDVPKYTDFTATKVSINANALPYTLTANGTIIVQVGDNATSGTRTVLVNDEELCRLSVVNNGYNSISFNAQSGDKIDFDYRSWEKVVFIPFIS